MLPERFVMWKWKRCTLNHQNSLPRRQPSDPYAIDSLLCALCGVGLRCMKIEDDPSHPNFERNYFRQIEYFTFVTPCHCHLFLWYILFHVEIESKTFHRCSQLEFVKRMWFICQFHPATTTQNPIWKILQWVKFNFFLLFYHDFGDSVSKVLSLCIAWTS